MPVKRRHEGGDRSSSAHAIRTAADAVMDGGAVGIFPEGRSHDEQRLAELKTGVGRIAVLAARDLAASGATGTVHVVPVALHFDSKARFRSGALVAVGEPLEVRPGDTPEEVTESVRRRLEDVLVHVDDDGQQRLLASVRVLIRRKLDLGAGADPRESHRVDREIALAIRRFHADEPERVRAFAERLQDYLDRLDRQGLTLHALEPASLDSGRAALALTLSPVAAWGVLHSIVPYQLARAIARTQARKSDLNMVATYGLWGGLLAFPAAWLVEALACWHWWGLAAAAVFLVTAPPTALVARWVLHVFRREVGRAVDMVLVARHPHAVRALKLERAWLWSELERWRSLHLAGAGPGAQQAETADAG